MSSADTHVIIFVVRVSFLIIVTLNLNTLVSRFNTKDFLDTISAALEYPKCLVAKAEGESTYRTVWIAALSESKVIETLDLVADAAGKFCDLLPGAGSTLDKASACARRLAELQDFVTQIRELLLREGSWRFPFFAARTTDPERPVSQSE